MKKNIFLSIVLITISIVFNSCGSNSNIQTDTDQVNDWQTLNEANYTIQFPDSFTIDKSGQKGISFILLAKQLSEQDLFRENVNLTIQDLTGQNIDLEKYAEISEEQIETMLIDGGIIESRKMKDDDKQYHKIIFKGKQGDFELKWIQHYFVKNNKAYILTFTSEENQYNDYKSIAEQIMSTFKIN